MAKTNAHILAAAIALIACIVLISSAGASTVTCEKAAMAFANACFRYIQIGGTVPPVACCESVANLKALAIPEKQQACNCLKALVRITPGMNPENLASIPAKCRATVGDIVALSTGCFKVE